MSYKAPNKTAISQVVRLKNMQLQRVMKKSHVKSHTPVIWASGMMRLASHPPDGASCVHVSETPTATNRSAMGTHMLQSEFHTCRVNGLECRWHDRICSRINRERYEEGSRSYRFTSYI